jgi:hypothetical protein
MLVCAFQLLLFFIDSLVGNHLTPNRVLHLSIFVHFCEAFLGIPFYYTFSLLLSFEAAP